MSPLPQQVKRVEKRFGGQLDQLREENSQLRRRVLQQAEQMAVTFARSTESTVRCGIGTRLKAVVQARVQANLSLAGELGVSPPQSGNKSKGINRPQSAPVTLAESQRARIVAMATRKPTRRPQTSISTIKNLL